MGGGGHTPSWGLILKAFTQIWGDELLASLRSLACQRDLRQHRAGFAPSQGHTSFPQSVWGQAHGCDLLSSRTALLNDFKGLAKLAAGSIGGQGPYMTESSVYFLWTITSLAFIKICFFMSQSMINF